MKVVVHQTEHMNRPLGPLTDHTQTLEEQFMIGIIRNDGLLPIPTIHHVINRHRIRRPQRSGESWQLYPN
ncbi:MAG: hypothetical protein M2R45_00325 [Verrucomicrobia subdivision 3 bacterium]|nr:hypothetical protein [Limisphaerales bacterium]MCS1412916.1 hypothetical protein [Limisphaerales bacterium]